MGEKRIEPGQVWRVNLGGHESRVLVVASHLEGPELWVCERLGAGQDIGEGMHILVAAVEFMELERPCRGDDEGD